LEVNTRTRGESNVKKILAVITLALTIVATSAFVANKPAEKAIEGPAPTPYIVSDPSGGGI
jgi:hypothetical protein